MPSFVLEAYGNRFGELLAVDRCRPLDVGGRDRPQLPQSSTLTVAAMFESTDVIDQSMAECCLAGVWLLYDQLDESHRVSQSISTPAGSFWHGIMHRREGDFSNAKYWFRQVGQHPTFGDLAQQANEMAASHGAEGVLPADSWNPAAMVVACQDVVLGRSGHEAYCRAVQQAEWEVLFDYCFRRATA